MGRSRILLVQPPYPKPKKMTDPAKYLPYSLFKLAGMFRARGDEVAPFEPDIIMVTTVFSYWFQYLTSCVDRLRARFPKAKLVFGGVHASLAPELYKRVFPGSEVHVGTIREAEEVEPAFDLSPYSVRTQITRRLAEHKVKGKHLTSIEVQGGFDVRVLSRRLDLIPLMKASRMKNVRLAWDGGLDQGDMVERCVEALVKVGYDLRNIRCYMLYNHEIPFETIVDKLRRFSMMSVGVVHSRFKPISLLHDGYVPQKRKQSETDYYIHIEAGWTDRKIRAIGSLASDISRMARARVSTIDEVREYYGRPPFEETVAMATA